MTENDTFHFEIAALTANLNHQVPITQDMKQQIGRNNVFDTLIFYNGSDKLYMIQINNNAQERFPAPANGGRVVWDKEDNIKFSSVQIIEMTGANATGTSYLTVARKEKNGA